jgi:hypothetical protein
MTTQLTRPELTRPSTLEEMPSPREHLTSPTAARDRAGRGACPIGELDTRSE